VLTILEGEFEALQAVFKGLVAIPGAGQFWSPDPIRLDVVIARSPDRGNVPALSAAAALLEQFRPEALILVGIGAGIVRDRIDEAAQLGDVVVPDYLHYAEFAKIARGRYLKRHAAYDQPSVSLRMDHVDQARIVGEWPKCLATPRPDETERQPELVVGALVAGDKVFSDPSDEFQRRVVEEHQDAVAVDMESFGVARAVHESRTSVLFNPRLLVIRGVSDRVFVDPSMAGGTDPQSDRDAWREYAAAAAACLAHEIVDRIVNAADDRDESRREERVGRETKS
jgi:nucleoside phosphorylase